MHGRRTFRMQAYHAQVHERHIAALGRRHILYYTDASTDPIPTQGTPLCRLVWLTYPTQTFGPSGSPQKWALEVSNYKPYYRLLNTPATATTQELRSQISTFTQTNKKLSGVPSRIQICERLCRKTLRHRIPTPCQPKHRTSCRRGARPFRHQGERIGS